MSAELGLLRKLLPSEPRHPNYLVANGECRSEICIGWIEQTRNVLVSKWSEPLFFTLDRPLRFCCKRCKNPFAQVKPQRPFVWTTRRDTMKTRLVPAVFLSDCLSNTRKIPVDFVQTNTKKERERERKRERERTWKSGQRTAGGFMLLCGHRRRLLFLFRWTVSQWRQSTLEETVPKKRASRRDVISQLSDFTFQRRLQRE